MRPLGVGLLVVLAVIVAGFVAERIFGPESDPMVEAKKAIEGIPYRVSVREASEGVLVGTVRGHAGAVVHFAASQEEPNEPSDIPPRLIQLDKEVSEDGGFSVWSDAEVRPPGVSLTAEAERGRIDGAIEGALCRKMTGNACPV